MSGMARMQAIKLGLADLVADFPDEYYEDLTIHGRTNRREAMTTKIINHVLTWGEVRAMERSHAWRVMRGIGAPGIGPCKDCGDDATSEVRYCPGVEPTIKESS